MAMARRDGEGYASRECSCEFPPVPSVALDAILSSIRQYGAFGCHRAADR
jgi:hypothetical protein